MDTKRSAGERRIEYNEEGVDKPPKCTSVIRLMNTTACECIAYGTHYDMVAHVRRRSHDPLEWITSEIDQIQQYQQLRQSESREAIRKVSCQYMNIKRVLRMHKSPSMMML